MSSFVLGFGSTEQAFEASEEAAIRAHVEHRYLELGLDYFTDAFVKEIEAWLKARSDTFHAEAAKYKTADEYPSRYSHYWPSLVADASHVVVILSVHHINRRHAMSPDGWALMTSKPVFVFDSIDIPCGETA